MKTVVGSFYTMTSCLKAIDSIHDWTWSSISPVQGKFLTEIYDICKNEVGDIKEIEYEVGIGTVVPVNDFLERKGFNIHLDNIIPEQISAASVLDLLVKWLNKGKSSHINRFPAALLNDGVQILQSGEFPSPIAEIKTKTDDIVLMTTIPYQPEDASEVFILANKLVETQKFADITYSGVKFPKIDLDVKPDVSWLVGMKVKENPIWAIAQALQWTKLKMNEEGFHVKEAFVIMVSGSCYIPKPPPLVFDKPFLFVVKRPGLKKVLFSAFLAEDCWKDPKNLDL